MYSQGDVLMIVPVVELSLIRQIWDHFREKYRTALHCISSHRSAILSLENVLQAELDQPGRHRGLADDAEVGRPKIRTGIGELRVIEGIVELYTESKLCVFPKAADRSRLTEREIRIELSRSVENTLTGISVTRRSIGPNCGRLTDCRLINPIVQTRRGSARGYQIFVCRACAKCDRSGSGETIDGAPAAVDQRH